MSSIKKYKLRELEVDRYLLEAKKRDLMLFGKYKITDTSMAVNTYQYMKKNGLLINLGADHSWIELSLLECIWLEIIESLRGFGCSTAVMKVIHMKLNINNEEEVEETKALRNINNQIKEIESIQSIDEEFKNALVNELSFVRDDKRLMNLISKDITHLSNLATLALKGYQTGFILYADKTIELFSVNDYAELFNNFNLTKSHVMINIWEIIDRLMEKEIFIDPISTIALSSEELKIINLCRDKDIRKIEVFKGPDNAQLTKIDSESFRDSIELNNINELKKILPKYKKVSFVVSFSDDTKINYYRKGTH